MELYFLEADQPITKRYTTDSSGQITKHPYPFVYQVTSFKEACPDIQTFEKLLHTHSKVGRTLVKGSLNRDLVSESRAGTTDPDAKTDWICLDLDGVDRFQTVDLFLEAIGCGGIDYILQWSGSMGVENKSGFRCHVFMLLATPAHPQLLKFWLQGLNFSVPELAAQLQLTRTFNSLRWPLDITTCQNDKLLYIAPPTLGPGIKDPFKNKKRITLQLRSTRRLPLPLATVPTKESLRELTHRKVNELRSLANMPKRKLTSFKYEGSIEYQARPDSAVITETKTERGFVYFNLNGGDSWAYYHPEDKPGYIYNFKGEPIYRTQDLLPEYWASISKPSNSYVANANGNIYLAFRDFASGQYWNAIYNTFADELQLAPAKSESQLRHFMKQHGQVLGDFIPDWNLVFDPQNPSVVDPDTRTLNEYRPSELFKESNPKPVLNCPPTIERLILHVMGDDVPTANHFLNWLAVIVQKLDRAGTAWVLHGTQGTGKGVLFHKVLGPMFGEWNVTGKRMDELDSTFTGYLRNSFLMYIDEVEAGRSLYHSKVTARLKNLIVEPFVSIRDMYRPAYMHRNRINMIFASNKPAPVEVDPDDRRFNVAPRQEKPLLDILTNHDIDVLIPAELPEFYAYLKHHAADTNLARTPLNNQPRKTLIDTNRLSVDVVLDNIRAGDLEALWDYLPSVKPVTMSLPLNRQQLYEEYRRLMIDLVTNQPSKLSRDDLFTILEWCVGNMPNTPNKLTSLLRHHRIHLTVVWLNNRSVRGLNVNWNVDPTWLAGAQADIAADRV